MRRLIGVLLAAAVVLMIAYALVSSGPQVPDSSVLVLEVAGELGEAPPVVSGRVGSRRVQLFRNR